MSTKKSLLIVAVVLFAAVAGIYAYYHFVLSLEALMADANCNAMKKECTKIRRDKNIAGKNTDECLLMLSSTCLLTTRYVNLGDDPLTEKECLDVLVELDMIRERYGKK